MRTVSRLSAQRRIFELTKAQKEEFQQCLEDVGQLETRNQNNDTKKRCSVGTVRSISTGDDCLSS